MIRRLVISLACTLLLISSGSTRASRPDKDWKSWFGNLSLGYASVDGDGGGESFDDDFYLEGGATLWPETSPVGLSLNASYSEFDAKASAIDMINDALDADGQGRPITGGDASVWGLTADGVWGTRGDRKAGFYVAAGVGMYYYKTQLETLGIISYPPVCGWYWCVPGGAGVGTVATTADSDWEWGWNVGVGMTFAVGSSGSQIFLEAKYHEIDTDRPAEILPISIGYRW